MIDENKRLCQAKCRDGTCCLNQAEDFCYLHKKRKNYHESQNLPAPEPSEE